MHQMFHKCDTEIIQKNMSITIICLFLAFHFFSSFSSVTHHLQNVLSFGSFYKQISILIYFMIKWFRKQTLKYMIIRLLYAVGIDKFKAYFILKIEYNLQSSIYLEHCLDLALNDTKINPRFNYLSFSLKQNKSGFH